MVQGIDADGSNLPAQIRIKPLGPHHDRAVFVCSKPHLTQYFTDDPTAKRTIDQDFEVWVDATVCAGRWRNGGSAGLFHAL